MFYALFCIIYSTLQFSFGAFWCGYLSQAMFRCVFVFCLFVCFGIHNHATWCFLAHFDASILTSSVQICVLYLVLCVTDQVFKCVFCVVCYISVQCILMRVSFTGSVGFQRRGVRLVLMQGPEKLPCDECIKFPRNGLKSFNVKSEKFQCENFQCDESIKIPNVKLLIWWMYQGWKIPRKVWKRQKCVNLDEGQMLVDNCVGT